jgi:hypothetical protein
MFQKDDWPSSDMYKEIDDWPDDRIHDEQGTFYVYLGDSHIFVNLFPDKQPSWVVASGRVSFGLDQEDFLCSFEVKDLEPEEVAQIKIALRHGEQDFASSTENLCCWQIPDQCPLLSIHLPSILHN